MPSHKRSHLRVAPATSECDYQSQVVTNERTNERTPEVNNDSDILQLSDVRARVEDFNESMSDDCTTCGGPYLNRTLHPLQLILRGA